MSGRLIILPFRTRPQVPDQPDDVLRLPEIPWPPGSAALPPAQGASRDDIIRLYEIFLGREPENEGAISGRVGRPIADIIVELTSSEEYRQRFGGATTPPPVGGAPPPSGTPTSRKIIDVSRDMPRDAANIPSPAYGLKTSITFHWEGAEVRRDLSDDEAKVALVAIANEHIRRDWGGGQGGYSIMYHEAIAPSGAVLILHDYPDVVWHAGTAEANVHSRAILVMCGPNSPPTPAQRERIRDRAAQFKVPVHAHFEWSPTACPGPEVTALVRELQT